MATEMITLKLETNFLKEIDSIVKENNYHNRTEFIRGALREKVDETRLNSAMMRVMPLKGASKKKTTDEMLEIIREKAVKELDKRFK